MLIYEFLRHIWHKLLFCIFLLTNIANASQLCFHEAASTYKVNDLILQAIAIHESRMNSLVITKNSNGSEDIGLTGINTVHLPELLRYGITRDHLLDPCINLHIRAWLLSKKIAKYGNTWKAVGASHSETPNLNQIYQIKVYKEYLKLKNLNTQ